MVLLVAGAALPALADEISPEAKAREARLLAKASPAVKTWVRDEGRRLAKAGDVNETAVRASVRSRFGALADGDIMAIAFLVMMQAAKSAQDDLKSIMDSVKQVNAQKQQQRAAVQKSRPAGTSEYAATNTIVAQRERPRAALRDEPKGKRDSLGELSETDQLRLQLAMDRRSKLVQTLSNMLKKFSETSASIIGNLK